MSTGGLAPNFNRSELECKCGCGGCNMSPHFLVKLQALRDRLGQPIKITSSFRCKAHNTASGGSRNSMHLVGKAADIYCCDSAKRHELVRLAIDLFGGIGIGHDFVHLDDRDRTRKLWVYP